MWFMFRTIKKCCEKFLVWLLSIFQFRKLKKVRALAHLKRRKSGEVIRKATLLALGKSKQLLAFTFMSFSSVLASESCMEILVWIICNNGLLVTVWHCHIASLFTVTKHFSLNIVSNPFTCWIFFASWLLKRISDFIYLFFENLPTVSCLHLRLWLVENNSNKILILMTNFVILFRTEVTDVLF